ncbi:MAG: aminoacyl-tRNA hydrolase [Spirochaetes bacterium]|nr:aminoacyl-tRNA hydrolase [Spirochaetota bacterium]
MRIIACLGNPGKKYARNRHNAGFLAGEYLAHKYQIHITEKRFSALCGSGFISNQKVLFLFPQTYMNQSGIAIKAALEYYDAMPAELTVIHDDIEIPFGNVHYKFGGGHKGQNGIRSTIESLESPDFHRIRIGVGRPQNPSIKVADYLLSDFTEEELMSLPAIFTKVEEILLEILLKGD